MWMLRHINANSPKQMYEKNENEKKKIRKTCVCAIFLVGEEKENVFEKLRHFIRLFLVFCLLEHIVASCKRTTKQKKNETAVEQRLQFVNNSKWDSQLAENCFDSNT